MPEDIRDLLLKRDICLTPEEQPRDESKIYELTLQLLQLWGVLQQQRQQQQQQQQEGLLREFKAGRPLQRRQLQKPLIPDAKQQQQQQQIERFVVYVPSVSRRREISNTPHFLAFASRTWMVSAAAPLLRAVAAAVAGHSNDLQQLTVFNADATWWRH